MIASFFASNAACPRCFAQYSASVVLLLVDSRKSTVFRCSLTQMAFSACCIRPADAG